MKLKGIINSFIYAISGIKYCLETQRNMKIHFLCGVIVLLLGSIVGVSSLEYVLLILVIGLVLAAEAFNTVVEHVVNILSPQQNKSAKLAKDIAAGAVLIAVLTSVLVGFIIFVPYFFRVK